MRTAIVSLFMLLLAGIVQAEQIPSWATQPVNTTCIVQQNAYPNGTVFHTVYGVPALTSNGTEICVVHNRAHGGLHQLNDEQLQGEASEQSQPLVEEAPEIPEFGALAGGLLLLLGTTALVLRKK